jgi:hypothetical protein
MFIHAPDQEEMGMLMSSVCKSMSCWQVGHGDCGRRGGGHNRQLASSKGLARIGIRHHGQGTAIPSKCPFMT